MDYSNDMQQLYKKHILLYFFANNAQLRLLTLSLQTNKEKLEMIYAQLTHTKWNNS